MPFNFTSVPLFLAPMAGITDYSMRVLSKEFGADFVTSEMVSAKAVHFKDKKTAVLARITDSEMPMAIQIFGNDPDIMAESAQKLEKLYSPFSIDINMGCPVSKIVGNKEGSYLMKEPELAGRIVSYVKSAVSCPVSVKIRAGWDDENKNAPEFAAMMEKNGADMICIHGRTKTQMYAPPVDLEIIRKVKKAVSVPVIGNGGINSAEDAMKMLDYTGCDGLAIARGACGSPWIFKEIKSFIDNIPYTPPSTEEKFRIAKKHFVSVLEDKGEYVGIREFRKHMGWYLRGIHGAAVLRMKINTMENKDEILCLLDEIIDGNGTD